MMEKSPSDYRCFEFASAEPKKFGWKTTTNRKLDVVQSTVRLEVSLNLNLCLGSSVHCRQKDSGPDLSLSLGSSGRNMTRRKVATLSEGPSEDNKGLDLSLSLAGSGETNRKCANSDSLAGSGENNRKCANSVSSGSLNSTANDEATAKQRGCQDSKRKSVSEKRRITEVDANSTENPSVMAPLQEESLVNLAIAARPVPEDHVSWDFRKKLTSSDVNSLCRLMLGKSVVEDKFFPLLTDYIVQKIKEDKFTFPILDRDTNSLYQMQLKRWKSGSYVFNNGWTMHFVKRRNLKKNDTIRLQWDHDSGHFNFWVIDQACN